MNLNKDLLVSIFKDIKNNPYITEKELGNKYNYHERTIRRYIRILKNDNLLDRNNTGIRKKWIIK